jgi:hypothetical protein
VFCVATHQAVAARHLGMGRVARVLRREALSAREGAFVMLVDASPAAPREREALVKAASNRLTVEEVNDAITVVALFELYNTLVDLHGVDPLTPAEYAAIGERLATDGYNP